MQRFRTEDYHTAGEPFRIVADLGLELPGGTVAERRVNAMGSAEVDRARTTVAGYPAVLPEVTGMAYRIGESTFTVDPHDPLIPGFVLR